MKKRENNSKIVIVNSVQDFDSNLSDIIYLIQDEIEILGNITLGDNCVLSFQGGILRTGTITGLRTSIDAPLTPIFGSDVIIAGSWRVPVAYPEWFEPQLLDITSYQIPDNNNQVCYTSLKVADDATRINRALNLLMYSNNISNVNTCGGSLQLTGRYYIYSPIIVPRHIYITGSSPVFSIINMPSIENVFPVDSEKNINNIPLLLNLESLVDDRFTITVNKEDQNHIIHSIVVKTALYYQNAAYDDVHINKGAGGRNFRVYMHGAKCHGMNVERAYDQSVWENIEIAGVDLSYNAFRFTVSDETDTQVYVGQTLILENCIGYHQGVYKEPATEAERNLTPVFYFFHQQEVNIIGCKAFPSTANINPKHGGTSFHFEGCRGIVIEGCGIGGYNGIEISSYTRSSSGFTIIGLTSEQITCHDVWAHGDNNTVAGITLLPIRHQTSNGDIRLQKCYNSFIVSTSPGQYVTLADEGTCNTILATTPLTKLDNNGNIVVGTLIGNTSLVMSNYNSGKGLTIQDALTVNGTASISGIVYANSGININDVLTVVPNGSVADVKINGTRRVQLKNNGLIIDNIPASTGGVTIKDNADNILFQSISNIASNNVGMNVWVNNGGSKKTLRVKLGHVNIDGTRGLVIQDNNPISTSGVVADKPTSNIYPGFYYYATDLGKPIWYNGNSWTDATGTIIT